MSRRRWLRGIGWGDDAVVISSLDIPGPAYEKLEVPFRAGSDTSLAAAQSMKYRIPSLRERCLGMIRAHDFGMTDEELTDAMGYPANTIRPRRIELSKAGLIEQCGTRKTKSGRSAVAWKVVND